jgi:hypothetical protein
MRAIGLVVVTLSLILPVCNAQLNRVERRIDCDCTQVVNAAQSYLRSRDFTQSDHDNELRSPKDLFDAQGKIITATRIRRDFASPRPPFFIWSTSLHASVHIGAKPLDAGCLLGLTVNFHSLRRMVVGIVPVNEALGLGSNGKLESEYLDAIAAASLTRQ